MCAASLPGLAACRLDGALIDRKRPGRTDEEVVRRDPATGERVDRLHDFRPRSSPPVPPAIDGVRRHAEPTGQGDVRKAFLGHPGGKLHPPLIPPWYLAEQYQNRARPDGDVSRIGMQMSSTTEFPNRIRELRLQKGWSATYLGQLAGGMAGPTVTRLETGERRLKHDQAQALAQALGVNVEALTDQKLVIPASEKPASALRQEANARFAGEVDVPTRSGMRRDLPIFGTAAGSAGDGAFFLNAGDVVDRASRPPSLQGNMKAYGLYVEGMSMAPAYNHGDFAVADPTKKVRPGDRIVVVVAQSDHEEAERMAYIKEFVRQTSERLTVKQYSPERELHFDMKRVVPGSIHRLLTMAELMGVG